MRLHRLKGGGRLVFVVLLLKKLLHKLVSGILLVDCESALARLNDVRR